MRDQRLRVLDLFSGLGGFSQAFKDRGHFVVRIDIDRELKPDVQADVRFLPIKDSTHFDVILASPPCEEFTKDFLPWYDGADVNRGLELVHVTRDVINRIRPRFWVVENVVGAVKYFKNIFGDYKQRCGSRYLWGNFPRFKCRHELCYGKERIFYTVRDPKKRKMLRSKIPYEISYNLCIAIENAMYSNLDVFKDS